MRMGEQKKITPLMNTADYGAGVDGDSIDMKNFHHATFICTFGAIAGDAVLKVYSGATDGAKTSALTFNYAFGGAAIGSADCDVLATEATSAALTLTGTVYDNFMLVIDIDAVAMDVDNGENWLTLEISSAGTSGILHIVAILDPRYTGKNSVSALA